MDDMQYMPDSSSDLSDDAEYVSFDQALQMLTETSDIVPDEDLLSGLSDLSSEQLRLLEPVWDKLSNNYRKLLIQMLVDYNESHFETNFEAIAVYALEDRNPAVRAAAIELLQESDSLDVMHQLIRLASEDPNDGVRAEATRGLGQFILASELDDRIPARGEASWGKVYALWNDLEQPHEIRCAALEALSNSSRAEVMSSIDQAYENGDSNMRLSAVIAMGHSCDLHWESIVVDEIGSHDPQMRAAAAHAAGEIQSEIAVPALGRLLEGDRDDQEAAIWALGEIGTREAIRLLRALEEQSEGDEDLLEMIDEALANASSATGPFGLLDLGD